MGAVAEMEAHPHCQAEGSVLWGVQLAPSSPRVSQTPSTGAAVRLPSGKW